MNATKHGDAADSLKKWIGALWQWIGVLLGAGLLYVLSIGPAVRLSEEGWLPRIAISKMYRPLGAIRGTPFDRMLNTYVRFWLPPPQQVDVPLNRPF
jgi:hypothetical protein